MSSLPPFPPPSPQATLREFLDAEGKALSDSTKDDPPLSKVEEQIAKYKALSGEISALPSLQTMGWVKVNAKPLRTALSTWVSKWTNLFTQYLQEKVGVFFLYIRGEGRRKGLKGGAWGRSVRGGKAFIVERGEELLRGRRLGSIMKPIPPPCAGCGLHD